MLRYKCPQCKAEMESPECLSGQTDICPACEKPVTVPFVASFETGISEPQGVTSKLPPSVEAADEQHSDKKPKKRGLTINLLASLFALASSFFWCTVGGAVGSYQRYSSGPGWERYESGTNPEMPFAAGTLVLSALWCLVSVLLLLRASRKSRMNSI